MLNLVCNRELQKSAEQGSSRINTAISEVDLKKLGDHVMVYFTKDIKV